MKTFETNRRLRLHVSIAALAVSGTLLAGGLVAEQMSAAHAAPIAGPADGPVAGPLPGPVAAPGGADDSPGDPAKYGHLTQPEWDLCKADLVKCAAAKDSRDFAFANSDKVAGVQTEKLNDKADAARHCLWQLSLSTFFDTGYAEQWGNVHEQNSDPMDTHAMDLHNNIVARALADDQKLKDELNAVNDQYGGPNPAGDAPVIPANAYDGVKQRIIELCTTAVSQAVQVSYVPQAGKPVADQLLPDPADRLVYFTPNP